MSGQNAEALDVLRVRFDRSDARFDKFDGVLKEHGDRLSVLETATAGTRRALADVFSQTALIGHRLDKLSDRTDRIERRLDLVEAP